MINAIIVMILFSYEADFFGRCKGVRTRAKCVSACMSFLEKYLLAVYLCLLSYLHRDICEVRYYIGIMTAVSTFVSYSNLSTITNWKSGHRCCLVPFCPIAYVLFYL